MTGAAGSNASGVLRLGMMGAGFIAQVTHLHALSELDDCKVLTIADNRQSLREAVARRYAVPRQLDNPSDLLSAPDIDAYVICLPRRAMAPAIEMAAKTGKPVLADKPMAHTLAQGRRIVAAAEGAGGALAVGFMKRHDPGVAMFREEIARLKESGELGEIVHMAVRDYCATYAIPIPFHARARQPRPGRYPEWGTTPDWLPTEQHEDYDVTLNVASHDINLLRHLLGRDLTAAGLRVRRKGIQLALLDAGTFDIQIEVARVDTGRWEQSIDIYFQRGLLRLDLPSPLARQETGRVALIRSGSEDVKALPPERRVWAFKAQAAQFLEVARGKASPVASGRDALADLEIIEALWKKVAWSRQ